MQALAEAEGDKQLAARLLGIGKTTLYRKLKEYKGSPNRCSAPIHALT
jgi:two-component system response regulator HydG